MSWGLCRLRNSSKVRKRTRYSKPVRVPFHSTGAGNYMEITWNDGDAYIWHQSPQELCRAHRARTTVCRQKQTPLQAKDQAREPQNRQSRRYHHLCLTQSAGAMETSFSLTLPYTSYTFPAGMVNSKTSFSAGSTGRPTLMTLPSPDKE